MTEPADLVIVGGGPVGATLALALRASGLRAVVLEARPAEAAVTDRRTLALSEGSRQILERLGVWQALRDQATPIRKIHISQRGGLGRSVLHADEQGVPQLGHVLSYAALNHALQLALNESGCDVRYAQRAEALHLAQDQIQVQTSAGGTHAGRLVVLADGGPELTQAAGLQRETHDYGQHAVVAHVRCSLPHHHVAYERFTPQGPVALLPDGPDGFALVWTATPDRAADLCALDEAAFLDQLQQHFGERAGHFVAAGARSAFPLKLSRVRPVTAARLAVIGNAAQTLHPVAGQGFNLGLRDAWELAQALREAAPEAIGTPAMLAAYARGRQLDTQGGMLFTDFLVRSFSSRIPGAAMLRGAGLGLLELCAPAKRFVANRMSYGANG